MMVRGHRWFVGLSVATVAMMACASSAQARQMTSVREGFAANDLLPPVIRGVSGDLRYGGTFQAMTPNAPVAPSAPAIVPNAGGSSDRRPVGALPWIPIVVAAFALVAWRLIRMSEPIDRGDR
jgi:hypothetical protein